MERFDFLVKGSSPESYHVTSLKNGTNISTYFTCPAGRNGQHANIDLGYSPDPLSMSLARMLEALNNRSWLIGSDIEATWVEVKRLEHKAEQVRSQMSQAKNSYCKSHAQLMRLTLQIEDDTSASTFDTFAH